MMKDDFYLTLPSHSSLQEFPQNANNNFKVRLPKLIRLSEGHWKVALASISVPDPKNALPTWLHDNLALLSYSSYYVEKNNTSNKIGFQTDVKLPHIKKHADVSFMTAHGFLKGLIEHAQKLYLQDNLYPGWLTGFASKIYHPEFIIKEDEIILDTSKIALTDMTGLIYPAIWINLTLALELGWFEEDEDKDDPQFAYKLGPNLSIQLNGYEIPSTTDIVSFFTANGGVQHVAHSDKYWIRPRWADGSLMDTIRISLDVSWRFINLDYAFSHVSNHSSRPLYVYSDVGSSNVLGDQITDFIRAINFRREGKGSYFYEPTHLHYIPLRKEVLDILQVQIAESTGELVNFGQGVTTVTLHFKNEKRLLPHATEQQ